MQDVATNPRLADLRAERVALPPEAAGGMRRP